MSIVWACDRCSKRLDDKGAMVSYLPDGWQSYQLVRIVRKNGEDFNDSVIAVGHLCDHCQTVLANKSPEIKFA